MNKQTYYLPTKEESTEELHIETLKGLTFISKLNQCSGYTFTEEELKLFLKKYVAFDYDGDYDDENGVIDEFLQTLKEK